MAAEAGGATAGGRSGILMMGEGDTTVAMGHAEVLPRGTAALKVTMVTEVMAEAGVGREQGSIEVAAQGTAPGMKPPGWTTFLVAVEVMVGGAVADPVDTLPAIRLLLWMRISPGVGLLGF